MPMLVADLPDAAVDALAAALDAYAPGTTAFNGARQVVEPLAAAVADRTGGSLRVHRSTGRFRLDEVVPPAPAVGAPGPADEPDGPLVVDWTRRFHADVDDPGQPPPDGVVLRRVAAGQFWLWRVDGEPVAMAALTPPAYGFVRVNLVYTPPRQRRRGYASALVAHLAQRVLDAGDTPTLFTDLANPTSNKIYRAIGFRLVDETATVEVVLAPTPGRGARGYPR
jgi:GNAT superfamily N-acetyltransferase